MRYPPLVDVAFSGRPNWAVWLKEKAGKMVPARDPSKGPFKPFEDAPGSFVKVKS